MGRGVATSGKRCYTLEVRGNPTASKTMIAEARQWDSLNGKAQVIGTATVNEQMVKEGANVTLISGTKVLQTTSGSYIEQSRLTKTGIDYAEFLLGSI